MATINIPESIQGYFPQKIDPEQLWVNYNPHADSLTIYFTSKPVPSEWEDIDDYVYLGFLPGDETKATGIMIEHFTKWLLITDNNKLKTEPV